MSLLMINDGRSMEWVGVESWGLSCPDFSHKTPLVSFKRPTGSLSIRLSAPAWSLQLFFCSCRNFLVVCFVYRAVIWKEGRERSKSENSFMAGCAARRASIPQSFAPIFFPAHTWRASNCAIVVGQCCKCSSSRATLQHAAAARSGRRFFASDPTRERRKVFRYEFLLTALHTRAACVKSVMRRRKKYEKCFFNQFLLRCSWWREPQVASAVGFNLINFVQLPTARMSEKSARGRESRVESKKLN